MKRITIIGSESFLARNYIKYIIENKQSEEYRLFLYDLVDKTNNSVGEYHQVDFRKKEDISEMNYDVDCIFIFAGLTGTVKGFENFTQYISANEILLLNILDVYRKKGSTARIIYPSTRLIYKSNYETKVSETDEIELRSVYAVTKYAAEQYLKIYHDTYGIDYVVLRICTPIGSIIDSYGNYGTYEIFKNQAIREHAITVYGDGKQKKTFTHIEDICKAFDILVTSDSLNYSEYNLGGQELCLLDIVKKITDEYNVPIKFVDWPEIDKKVDGGSIVFDSSRFDDEFSFSYKDVK